MIYEVTNNELPLVQGKLTIIDFNAAWCGPCRALHPILEEIVKEHPEVDVYFVDVDANEALATDFNVRSIPMLIYHREDGTSSTSVGSTTKTKILERLGLK